MLRKLGDSPRKKGEEVWESKEGLAQLRMFTSGKYIIVKIAKILLFTCIFISNGEDSNNSKKTKTKQTNQKKTSTAITWPELR